MRQAEHQSCSVRRGPPTDDICAAQGGWLCSELDCSVAGPASSLTPREGAAQWFAVGDATTLALQAGRLVEYDMLTRFGSACKGFVDIDVLMTTGMVPSAHLCSMLKAARAGCAGRLLVSYVWTSVRLASCCQDVARSL